MTKLNLLQPGTTAWVKSNQPFPVEIQAVHIFSKDLLVSYDVFWWDNFERKLITVSENEIQTEKIQHLKVGFANETR